MGKVKFRDLRPRSPFEGDGDVFYNEFKALLINAVTIKGVPADVERFIKATMIEQNSIGYDTISDMWALCYGEGINEYWLPTRLNFVFPGNRTSFQRPAYYEPSADGAYLIRALPSNVSFSEIIRNTTDIMRECYRSIIQNVQAVRTPFIGICRDKDLRLSVEQAILQKSEGVPAIVVNPDVGEALKGVNFDTPYIAADLKQLMDIFRDQLLNKLGIMTANVNKRERVQVGEVDATVNQCVDYIYTWIDTVNKQFESYGLADRFQMVLNGALEDYYSATDEENTEIEEEETDDFEKFNS